MPMFGGGGTQWVHGWPWGYSCSGLAIECRICVEKEEYGRLSMCSRWNSGQLAVRESDADADIGRL